MLNFVNPSTNKFHQSGKVATTAGHRPGSGEWWQALRADMTKNHHEQKSAGNP